MTTPTDPRNAAAMAKLKAASKLTAPQADFMSCILGAILAAMPAFLAAFMECLGSSNGPGSDQYQPGDRPRCP